MSDLTDVWRYRRWPTGPLEEELTRRLGPEHSYPEAADLLGVNHDSWGRCVRRGYVVGDVQADRLATRLERHPVLFWPDWCNVAGLVAT